MEGQGKAVEGQGKAGSHIETLGCSPARLLLPPPALAQSLMHFGTVIVALSPASTGSAC